MKARGGGEFFASSSLIIQHLSVFGAVRSLSARSQNDESRLIHYVYKIFTTTVNNNRLHDARLAQSVERETLRYMNFTILNSNSLI